MPIKMISTNGQLDVYGNRFIDADMDIEGKFWFQIERYDSVLSAKRSTGCWSKKGWKFPRL